MPVMNEQVLNRFCYHPLWQMRKLRYEEAKIKSSTVTVFLEGHRAVLSAISMKCPVLWNIYYVSTLNRGLNIVRAMWEGR